MIRLVEKEEQLRRLLALCEKTAFGCKIASLALAYGFDKGFACFWLDDQDQVVYCLADGVMLLSGTVVRLTKEYFAGEGKKKAAPVSGHN